MPLGQINMQISNEKEFNFNFLEFEFIITSINFQRQNIYFELADLFLRFNHPIQKMSNVTEFWGGENLKENFIGTSKNLTL